MDRVEYDGDGSYWSNDGKGCFGFPSLIFPGKWLVSSNNYVPVAWAVVDDFGTLIEVE